MSEAFAVPKYRVEAGLKLLHQEPVRVLLHLAERAAHHSGRELPSDLLNGKESVFPVSLVDDGRFVLVRRLSVVWTEVGRADERTAEGTPSLVSADDPEAASATVDIQFEDGSRTGGEIRWILPEGRRRPQDFLDAAATFFPVCDGDVVRLVNRERIALIELP